MPPSARLANADVEPWSTHMDATQQVVATHWSPHAIRHQLMHLVQRAGTQCDIRTSCSAWPRLVRIDQETAPAPAAASASALSHTQHIASARDQSAPPSHGVLQQRNAEKRADLVILLSTEGDRSVIDVGVMHVNQQNSACSMVQEAEQHNADSTTLNGRP